MKLNRHITKFVAFIFLLMLGQKTGVGLLLHNLFHITENKKSGATSPDNKAISYACNCIDNFSSPLDETVTFDQPALIIHQDILLSFSRQPATAAFYLFSSLRAPPVFVT